MTPDETEQLDKLLTALRGRFSDQGVDRLIEEGILSPDIAAGLRALAAAVGDKVSGDKVGGDKTVGSVSVAGSIHGVAVGVNLGNIIYGHDPTEEQHKWLVSYLRRLSNTLDHLSLRGIIERPGPDDSLSLPSVYVMLATQTAIPLPHDCDLTRYFDIVPLRELQSGAFTPSTPLISLVKDEYQPDIALPYEAITQVERLEVANGIQIKLFRAQLATEAFHEHHHMVLLGDLGGGKSTFVQHLAWALAQRGIDRLDDDTRLFGWEDTTRLLPVLLPLRTLAGCLASEGTVIDALRGQITAISDLPASAATDMFEAALDHNAALLLFDGLDEVPQEPVAPTPEHAGSANQQAVLLAVADFVKRHRKNLALITCRTHACAPEVWRSLGWRVERLAPFTLGQMRHFVDRWYKELANKELTKTQAQRYTQVLQTELKQNEKMQKMGGTPLLLAMMTLLVYHDSVLPRDRSALYERILKLLLGQWDKRHEGQNLAEAIGYPGWDSERFQPLLDDLSYQAHATASSPDGRGQLLRSYVRDKLIEFFERLKFKSPWDAARRCLEYIGQRSGLLLPDRADTYTFAHLTLQEYCAGRWLAIRPDAANLVMDHRKDDRWREPIFLGLGCIKRTNPALVSEVLTRLTAKKEYKDPKPTKRWYKDLILAAELGADCDWSTLGYIDTVSLQDDLRAGLVTLLEERRQRLPVEERIRAGLLLGDLGDPRIPLSVEDWRREIRQAPTRPRKSGYWRYVRTDIYRIGRTSNLPEIEISLPAFWISRLTITVAQYEQFIEAGGYQFDQWWTPTGQQWKRTVRRQKPTALFGPLKSNQPIIGVAWYEAAAWAEWLNQRLADILPPNFEIRLPTEAEWEAACYNSAMEIPTYPWGNEEPTPDLAIYDQCNLNEPAPVGVCPRGATGCGALDMGGNVWEWTTTKSSMYPHRSNEVRRDFQGFEHVAIRGGSFQDKADSLGARNRHLLKPEGDFYRGFRIVLAPRQRPDT